MRLKCEKCGFLKTLFGKDNIYDKCPLCQGKMVMLKAEIEKVVTQDCLIKMQKNIKELGNAKVWQVIENIPKAETRLAYRQWFFKAGGTVPKVEI